MKPRYDLIPALAQREVALVLAHGATVYGDEDWRERLDQSVALEKAMRHIEEHRLGVFADPETGRSPIAHAIADLLFLLELMRDEELAS